MISIVVITHNRVRLLRDCVANVLARTSDATTEIVIWNNASTDGTAAYLETIEDPRVRIVNHPRNIGQNAYAQGFALTSQPYLIEVDDDVTDAPDDWDATLVDAYKRLPKIGFLAANLVDDPNDPASYFLNHQRRHLYTLVEENGITLLKGPTGGGCAVTSRDLYDRVGGFRRTKGKVFWLEDEAYINDIANFGYEPAYLEGLRVHHTGGPYYAPASAAKDRFWEAWARRQRRKSMIKRALLRLPMLERLNERHNWFEPPKSMDEYEFRPRARV